MKIENPVFYWVHDITYGAEGLLLRGLDGEAAGPAWCVLFRIDDMTKPNLTKLTKTGRDLIKKQNEYKQTSEHKT